MTRQYNQTARAEATAEREERVLDAAFDAFFAQYYEEVTLKAIAEAAETTEQTVIRYFGSKEGLLEATIARRGHRLGGQRVESAQPGDWRRAITVAVDAYEEHGRRTLLMLSQEERIPAIKRGTNIGRAAHRSTVETTFGPYLGHPDDPSYEEALAPLIVVLDVFTWKLLRLDLGLSRDATVRVMTELVAGHLNEPARDDRRPS